MALPNFNDQDLLPEGMHLATEEELHERCVEPFPKSTTRNHIFEGFCDYRDQLEALGMTAAQWVNGSFVDATRLNPEDVDVVNFCSSQHINALSSDIQAEARELLLGGPSVKSRYRTHAFLTQTFPEGHPFADRLEQRVQYWTRLFSTPQHYGTEDKFPAPERGRKGFVLMNLGNPATIPQPSPI